MVEFLTRRQRTTQLCRSQLIGKRSFCALSCHLRVTCLHVQIHGDDAIDYLEHLARDHRAVDEEKTQLDDEGDCIGWKMNS